MSAGPWILVIDWLPLTPANRWYKGHWSKTAALVTDWRCAAITAARLAKLPTGVWSFSLTVQARHNVNKLTDFDAFAPAAKAICDGLVAGPKGDGYGLAADDDPEHARRLTLLPSFLNRTLPPALLVSVVVEEFDDPAAAPSAVEETRPADGEPGVSS